MGRHIWTLALLSTLLLWAIVEGAKPPIDSDSSSSEEDVPGPRKKAGQTKSLAPPTTPDPKKKVVVTKAPVVTVPTTTPDPKRKLVVTKAPAVTVATTARKLVATKAPVVTTTPKAKNDKKVAPAGPSDGKLIGDGSMSKKNSMECEKPDCVALPDPGRCRAMVPSYFWNATIKFCDMFDWGGCAKGSNCNRFETLENCNAACDK